MGHDVGGPSGRPDPAEAEEDEGTDRLPDAASHFRSPELAAALARRLAGGPVDVAHVEEVVMAQYVELLPCPTGDRPPEGRLGLPRGDGRGSSLEARLGHLREAARFRWWERRLVGAFDRILVPGRATSSSSSRCTARPRRPRPHRHRRRARAAAGPAAAVEHVLLYGALDYGPNVEAQQWFFREVWPDLRAAPLT